MIDLLRGRGAIADRTRLIATHFTHNIGMMHADIVHHLLPHGVEVAFDGMSVKI
jgi:phosphoribosyl 1,2-cyclic phosphate phosphodiesterase